MHALRAPLGDPGDIGEQIPDNLRRRQHSGLDIDAGTGHIDHPAHHALTLRPAPSRGSRGRYRLNPDFAEWLIGLPAGWVTDVPGLPYSAKIRALGNGVVPRQVAAALRLLAAITVDAASAWPGRLGIGLEDDHAA